VREIVGALVIPALVVGVFLAFPLTDGLLSPRTAHRFTAGFMMLVLGAMAWLTYGAWRDDRAPPPDALLATRAKAQLGESLDEVDQVILRAGEFHRLRRQATLLTKRALERADEHGIPPGGPLALLANDAVTRGPRLFATHCATCHRVNGHNGLGVVVSEAAGPSDLAGFASRAWIRGLLADLLGNRYFGPMLTPDGEPAHT
jgi:ubiquinol-cytochrome c reductase cytochrome b subunit